MTFSEKDMSEFADGDFENISEGFGNDDASSSDIFKSIRATENSKLNNQKQVQRYSFVCAYVI